MTDKITTSFEGMQPEFLLPESWRLETGICTFDDIFFKTKKEEETSNECN